MSQQSSLPMDSRFQGHKGSQSILKKGRACVNCRRRKMKCDGVQPICGSCMRTEKAEDCEYTTGSERSTTQKLEAQVDLLQARLRDLQTSSDQHQLQDVTLQQPYGTETVDRRPLSSFQEPPRQISQRLLDTFLAHASQYGFFLHPGRFRNSVQFPGPVGHESRPLPSLLATMYLLGIHFTHDTEIKRREKVYFDLALHHISQDTISTTMHPKHRLHVIQSELLLAHYFFSNQRPTEGTYHAHSAYSLAIASGIHRMRTRNPPELTLPPAADDIDEGERVNAFWAVFCTDKEWAGALNINPTQRCPNLTGVRLLTPMPREIEDYETGYYRCEHRNGRTIDNFMSGNEPQGEALTSRALHLKAAVIFERACTISRLTGIDTTSKQRGDFGENFRGFRNLAMNFKSTVVPLETWLQSPDPNLDIVRTAYVGITLLDAAMIRIHGVAASQGDASARRLREIGAEAIFNNSIRLSAAAWNFGFLNPIIAHAWREAFNVLFEQVARTAAQSQSWSARQISQSEDPLRRQLRKGVAFFATYSKTSRFIGREVEEMTNLLQGTVSY